MNDILLTAYSKDNKYKYEVYYDVDGFENSFENPQTMLEFDNKEDLEAHKQKHIESELSYYGVVKYEVCKCCCMWAEKDALWGIDTKNEEEALKTYLQE